MKERNTKQKDIITSEIMNTKSHPTIKQLCNMVKEKDSSIGQATVYRQIDRLVSEGKVRKIANENGDDYYDGNIMNHAHFVCNKCDKVFDIEDDNLNLIFDYLSNMKNNKIDSCNIVLRGVCSSCLEEESSNEI